MEEDSIEQDSQLLQLPHFVLEKILLYLSYDEIAQRRLICRKMNEINKRLLNNGFNNVEKYYTKCFKEVKAQLPRRESKRRSHPLFRRSHILNSIGTRLGMLKTTYNKYVALNMCCFIPGKVIDEIFRVIRVIQNGNPESTQAYEVITELRDISSMAMEHFEEHIISTFKAKKKTSRISSSSSSTLSSNLQFSSMSSYSPVPTNSGGVTCFSNLYGVTLDQLHKLQPNNKHHKNNINSNKKVVSEFLSKIAELTSKVNNQEQLLKEQNHTISEMSSKLSRQECRVKEVNKKLLEYEQKFANLIAKVSRLREDGYGEINNISKIDPSTMAGYPCAPVPVMGSSMFLTNMMQSGLVPMGVSMQPLLTPTMMASAALSPTTDMSQLMASCSSYPSTSSPPANNDNRHYQDNESSTPRSSPAKDSQYLSSEESENEEESSKISVAASLSTYDPSKRSSDSTLEKEYISNKRRKYSFSST